MPDQIVIDYDQELHRAAWMLLCANEDQKQIYVTATRHEGRRAVVTGYPKLDRLVERGREESRWPIDTGRRGFRLIWAPHHSCRKEWLGFGMFHQIYKEILQWITDNQDVEIILKPHPMLFESRAQGVISEIDLDVFMNAWTALQTPACRPEATTALC